MDNDSKVEKIPIRKVSGDSVTDIDDIVAREFPLTIILNNSELVTLLCSPADLKNLAIGFLWSEGLVTNKDELKKILLDEIRGVVRVETTGESGQVEEVFKRFISSGCGRGTSFYSAADAGGMLKVESELYIPSGQILSLFKNFQHRSELYRNTGGVHSAALCGSEGVIVFAEDVGRHNAIDKIFGKCLLDSIATDDHIVLTSGRVSSEILLKVARRNIPVIASKSAPTDLGVKLAKDLGITLVGFVRGGRMNIYANEWRINDGR